MCIQQVELFEQQVNGDHTHESREHSQNEQCRQRRLAAFKAESRYCVACEQC
ncbi:hypothetical protein D3C72_1982860 [compost metagenome]